MAEKQKGNLRQQYNISRVGMDMDHSANQIDRGKVSYALNANIENYDQNSINYGNEEGNVACLTFPEGYLLIGKHFIVEKNKHIFFLAMPDGTNSQIGYMDDNDCEYHTLVSSDCLSFNINYPIQKIAHRITNCTTEIYWTDGINPRRYLDIDNIPWMLQAGSDILNPIYTDVLDCNQLKIQPNFSIPSLLVNDVVTGGNLISGTYQFAIQYSDAVGNPFTSYYSVTNPTPIFDESIVSVNFNTSVGKSIVIAVDNLDLTGQFQYYNIAVIKTINGITSVELAGTYFINALSNAVIYTGQSKTDIRLSINDIFEKYPYYEIAQDLTTVQDVLVWGVLTSVERINYQHIANSIQLQWETWRIPATENYADEINATNLRGYLRDEIYPFEIVFLLKNGQQTDGFHIPGRIAKPSDLLAITAAGNNDFVIDGATAPYWKIYNTASVIADSTGHSADSGYKGPWEYGDFAYWESSEVYPANTEVWGALANTPIRHHKFPDVLVSPIHEAKTFAGLENLQMGDNAIYPIGVKIDSAAVELAITNSSLTQAQKDQIVGYKIVRGDRSNTKSIVAKGILRNVGTYSKEENDYIYPNYPYNDLTEDPFLNSENNAFQDLCDTYTIDLSVIGGATARINYTDCNTNKPAFRETSSLVPFDMCSASKPVIVVPAVGTVGLANYDIYRVGSTGFRRGWTVGWLHPVDGESSAYLCGDFTLDGDCQGNPRRRDVHCVVGTVPVCVDYCDRGGKLIEKTGEHRSTLVCGETDIPLIPIDDDYKNRQIFNSPETSFGQPFLGNVLKLESTMYGKGLAHFTEVKDNAKYKLLTEEAQRKALQSAEDLTSDPIDSVAFFTAYEAYLAIYLNAIAKKNYAYSYNSIADYAYTGDVENLGNKQRAIDIARYLIPGVQSIDGDKINNYQRETSVFVKTEEPLSYPQETPSALAIGITDESRETISTFGNCDAPNKEADIRVLSYYASIKNEIINLWGQLYSYETIDTGHYHSFDSSQNKTIFGGDTFIGKFAFKTKLPFFIDNRVNAPDDSDIFYDEIGNVAYPKYWHSARSITKDYVVQGAGVLPNLISYKAHNFDCPNIVGISSETTTTTTTIAGSATPETIMYYDGYYYLFAYGIPSFYCESSYNLDLRQAFNNKEGEFWPHVSSGIPDDWVQESFVSIAQDNTYYYNTSFSKQNKENTFTHLPFDWDSVCYKTYPFRAIYSDNQYTGSDVRINNWLIYKPLSYFDFPQNYGELTSLDGIQNKAILARFENKTLLYNNLLTLDTSNPQMAYLGNPRLFDGAPPIDFADTDLGYIGCQHKMLLKIPQGQITVDAKRGQIFLIRGTEAIDLVGFGSGVNRFFTDHLAFEILRWFPELDVDNNFTGVGLHGVYDSKYDRVIITKLDYIPIQDNITYDAYTKKFYINDCSLQGIAIETPTGAIPEYTVEIEGRLRKEVFLDDREYFCNKSWTISYNLNTNSWISFHSYLPNYYIGENNFFYSGINSCCADFDFIVGIEEDTCNFTITGTETYPLPTDCEFTITKTIIPQIEEDCDFTLSFETPAIPAVCNFSLSIEQLTPPSEDCDFIVEALVEPVTPTECDFIISKTNVTPPTNCNFTVEKIPLDCFIEAIVEEVECDLDAEIIEPTTTTTTTTPLPLLGYGLLYNNYVVSDERSICASGYRVPTLEDFESLVTYCGEYAGGKLKRQGNLNWLSPNTGATNIFDFNGVGGGSKGGAFNFAGINEVGGYWSSTTFIVSEKEWANLLLLQYNEIEAYITSSDATLGRSIKIVRNATPEELLLDDGIITDIYIGNNLIEYSLTKIGDKVWLSENLKETKYANGDLIPEFTGEAYLWSQLTTGALCAYNNDWNNV